MAVEPSFHPFSLDATTVLRHTRYVETDNTQNKTVPEKEAEIKRTSVNIPADIWGELKVIAFRRNMTTQAAVEAAIRSWVHESQAA